MRYPDTARLIASAGLAVAMAVGLSACRVADRPVLPGQVAAQGGAAASSPDKVGRFSYGSFLAGRHAEAINDIAAAADFMGFVLSRDPENLDLLRRTLLLRTADGRIEEATGLAERVLEREPSAPVANILVALEDSLDDRGEAARGRLEALPARGVNRMIVPLVVAWIAYEDDDIDAALTALSPLEDVASLVATFHLHAGLINDLAGREEAALAHYRAATDGERAPALRMVQALGSFLARTGKPADARAVYDRYEAEHPSSRLVRPDQERLDAGGEAERPVVTAAEGIAEALFGAAGGLYRQGDGHMALVFGHMALHARPDFSIGQILIADILESLGRLEQANAIYAGMAAGSTSHWHARLRQVNNLAELGRFDDAMAQLDAMAGERPADYEPLFRRGNLLRQQERFAEAAVAYDEAMARVDTVEPRHWALYYARGIALERSKEWPRAEADFIKALELRPEQPYVLNYLGYSWADQGLNLDRAQAMIENAVTQRPNDGFIVDSLGWVLYRLGDFRGAVRQLERAIELTPEDTAINDHLGDAYWRVGRRQEARFQWRRALSHDPDDGLTAAIEEKLKHGLRDNDRAEQGG